MSLSQAFIYLVCREAKQKEEEEKALKDASESKTATEEDSSAHDSKADNQDEETRAAVVLQSNYRGFKERKKFKERRKTVAGAELASALNAEADGGQEAASARDKEGKAGKEEENDEEEESTYEAEDNDDSDHTQVPEDDGDTEVADEAVIEDLGAAALGLAGKEEEEDAKEEKGLENVDEETKAATVLQSNFRGHKERKRLQEEGKIPAKKHTSAKSPAGEQEEQVQTETCSEETELTKDEGPVDVSSIDVTLENQDETKAAVVLQSNFRGHKERKRLEEEGKIPKRKNAKEVTPEHLKENQPGKQAEESQPGASVEEEKAATVLQSNFRGYQERKKLKAARKTGREATEEAADESVAVKEEEEEDALDVSDIVIGRKEDADAERERLEEEHAAVKIQSNFRGYKERKNLKAGKQTSQVQAAQLESFSKEVISRENK